MAKEKKKMGTIDKFKTENSRLKIFVLHGWTYSKDKWDPFLNILKSKGLNPHLLSVPGLTDKIDKPWNIDDYANWLLKQTKDGEKIILIGHSNGGRIALNFAVKYPNKVSSLILIDSAGVYRNDFFIKIKRIGFLILAKIGKKLFPFASARKLLYFIAREKDYNSANPIMKKTMINLLESDKSLNLNKISVPTIIIWGKNDKITPLSDGKLLNQLIAESRLSIIAGARHSPQFTHPEKVANIIFEQLKNTVV